MNNSRRYIVGLSTIILLAAVTIIMIIKGNRSSDEMTREGNEDESAGVERTIETAVYQVEAGWGYDVFVDGKRLIHQPYIPVLQGNKPFDNVADAKKVAEFVAGKIRMNSIPPTVSYRELDSLGIIK
jgi:hypothetical protein